MTEPGSLSLSRRGALAGAGAFAFGFVVPFGAQARAQSAATGEINAWIVVSPDESVVIRMARVEMGQGSLTGLAQLVAEELDCDWSRVRVEQVEPGENRRRGRVWRDQSTGGSRAVRGSQEYLRRAGATARAMLVAAAARRWGAPVALCEARGGVIRHLGDGRQTTYGAVAALARDMPAPTQVALKDPKDWTIAGRPLKRLDAADKLDGSLVYGVDLRLPDMLIALPKACPVHGGKLRGFDAAAVAAMRGVKAVLRVDDETVAVVADSFWRAKKALDALPIAWDEGPNARVSSADVAAWLREGLDAETRHVGHRAGDAAAALARAPRIVEAEYAYPHQNHAPMEVIAATALWTPRRCEVWAPTQVPEAALEAAALAAGLPIEACDLRPMRIGGSFGRRLHTDYIRMAVLIARQTPGVPVKMIWTREEDMAQGRFHPVTRCRLRGALAPDGSLEALHMRIAGQSILAATRPQAMGQTGDPIVFQGLLPAGDESRLGYAVPNLLVDHAMRNPHIRPGAWRGVNLNQNTLYLECFVDELAHAAGVDPLVFRRRMLADSPRHLAVLEAAAAGIGWDAPAPRGRARGLAQVMGFGSYVAAAAAEVSVEAGRLRIHRLVAATDPGHAVNPQQIEAQVAGSFVYGLSAMLYGECTVRDGRIEQSNFDSYPVMRLDEAPHVEVIVMPSGGFWGGVGEPTIAVAAPAVLNALFAATGQRVRDMPLRKTALGGA